MAGTIIKTDREGKMISVGGDVSKGKNTVCILKLDGEIRIVMEVTGIYHLPVLTFLYERETYLLSIRMQ